MKKIILLLVIIMLGGCYDYNELSDLSIVSSMFIDYKDQYIVTLEIYDTNKEKESPSYFIEGKGITFNEALKDIYTKSSRHIYLNHINVVVLSKKVAKEKLIDLYDYFWRDPDIRKDSYFLVSSNLTPFFTFKTEDRLSIGEEIKNIIEYNLKENANFKTSKFNNILNSSLNKKNYFLGEIIIDNNMIKTNDVYIVSKNKLDLKLDDKSVFLANMLDNTISSFLISNKDTFEIYKYKLKKKVYKDKIEFIIKCDVRLMNIINKKANTINEINNIENYLNKYLSNSIKEAINYSKYIDKDIYNFNYLYYLYYPKLANKDSYKKLKYVIKVDTVVNEKGLLIKTLGSDAYEEQDVIL